jgi:hypothetical protein
MGEELGLSFAKVRHQPLDRLRHPHVQPAADIVEETAVRHLLRERVLERQPAGGHADGLVQELGGLQMTEAAAERRVGQLGHVSEERDIDVLADDGRDLQDGAVVVGEPVEPGRQDALDRVRHAHLRPEVGMLRDRARELLEEERHAVRVPEDRLRELCGQPLFRHDAVHDAQAVVA